MAKNRSALCFGIRSRSLGHVIRSESFDKACDNLPRLPEKAISVNRYSINSSSPFSISNYVVGDASRK